MIDARVCTCHDYATHKNPKFYYGRTDEGLLRFVFMCPNGRVFDIYDMDDRKRSVRKFITFLLQRVGVLEERQGR